MHTRKWTPIARRDGAVDIAAPAGTCCGLWRDLDGAPISAAMARAMYDDGLIELAQRRRRDGVAELVYISRKRRAADRPPYFAWGSGGAERMDRKPHVRRIER